MFLTRRGIGRTGALLGARCGATGPQEPAEPVRVDRPNPVPESATAPPEQPRQGYAKVPESGLPGLEARLLPLNAGRRRRGIRGMTVALRLLAGLPRGSN